MNVAPTAAAVWAERMCEVAGGAMQNSCEVFRARFCCIEMPDPRSLARVQPAKLPLQMRSALPNARGALEDTQVSCEMEKRLQTKFE